MSSQLSDIGEFGLIEKLTKNISLSSSVRLGVGDDTAVMDFTKEKKLLLTTDMLVEGVHFDAKMNPRWIGRKALAVSISDIAAMGGLPKSCVVSLGVSPKQDLRYLRQFYSGMEQIAKDFSVDIVGGDTVRSPHMVVNVALTGEARTKHILRRDTARVGDKIFVTGPLGNSYNSQHHLKFIPRIKESQYLVKHCKPSAMIDISDGLAADLNHIFKSSQVSAQIFEDKIPLRRGANYKNALSDGEDFELAFTLSVQTMKKRKFIKSPYPFFEIGEIIERKKKSKIVLKSGKNINLPVKGYTHF